MSYQLRGDETLGDGMRRIICEQIESAIEASTAKRNGKASPVHETRKHLKKARSAVRMVSDEVLHAHFRREYRSLRSVARLISEIRDAEARLQTVRGLRELSPSSKDRNLRETEELLAFELDSFLAAFSDWQEEAKTKLTRVQDRIAQWPIEDLTSKTIRQAAQRSYKRGRQALRRARKRPTAENFHSFRKETKQLWYQLRILRPLHPAILRELSDELKGIGQHLGHAHDLAFLAERLRTTGGPGRKRGARALDELIEARQRELQRMAAALGERFYAQRSREFGERLMEYFAEWEIGKLSGSRMAKTIEA
jgi:CHAD domain-containing protein